MSENALPESAAVVCPSVGPRLSRVSIRCRTVAVQPLSPHDMRSGPRACKRDRAASSAGTKVGTSGGLMRDRSGGIRCTICRTSS